MEGCNYVIECLACRKKGVKSRYFGESRRSPYPRGNEHAREINEGVGTHPLVIHMREEYSRRQQEVLMRVISKHITPLDRQMRESLNIIKASKETEECLNLKSE